VTLVLPARWSGRGPAPVARAADEPRRLRPTGRWRPRTTVAVRVPDPERLRALVRAAGAPLVSTSANRSGAAPPTHLVAAAALWGTRVDAVWDPDGELKAAAARSPRGDAAPRASTLVDLAVWPPQVLRAGDTPPPPWDDIA
jgi:tRNA A37 threonylcarbamoyladenosine synthetase subunit TsaC/SUA5/YrdC